MRGCALLLLGCASCDFALGLHHFDPQPIDAALPEMVSGMLLEHVVTNNPDFTPKVTPRFYPAAELTLAVTLSDESTPAVTYDESDGTFTFERPAGLPYRLHITTTELGETDFQLSASSPVIGIRSLNRTDAVRVTKSTLLHFQYGATPGSLELVSTTGVGSSTNPGGNVSAFDLDWKNAIPFTGPIDLLDAAKNDRLYYTQLTPVGSGSTGYNPIGGYVSLPVTIVDGTAQTLSGTLTPATSGTCAHIVALRGTAQARQIAGAPRTYSEGAEWSIYAAPPRSIGAFGPILIVLANEGDPATDVDVMPMFSNPYPGTVLLASLSAGGSFNLQLGGATPKAITDLTRTYVPLDISGSCIANVVTLRSEIAIPRMVSIDGIALDHDNQPVALAAATHVVEWTSGTGPIEYANLTLFEVSAPAGVTRIDPRFSAVTTLGNVTLPGELFVSGHTYIMAVENRLGFDGASGNLDTVHYPVAFSRTSSFSFLAM